MTSPNQKDHHATQTTDSSVNVNADVCGKLCGSCALCIRPSWYYNPGQWDDLVKEFDNWLVTQPPTPTSLLDNDLPDSSNLSDSQDSLDSSTVRQLFRDTDVTHHERSCTPPNIPAHTPGYQFQKYWADEDYSSGSDTYSGLD